MFGVKLKTEPAFYDEYNQPCYPVSQDKGLAENEREQLTEDAISEGYITEITNQLLRVIKREVQAETEGRLVDVLEIGGGDGYFFDWVQDSVRSYINVEPGKVTLNEQGLQRINSPRYQCVRCSAESIPLYDESADIILALGSFDHIPDYRKAVGEIKRLLRKDGVFILLMNNRRSWWKFLLSRTDYLRHREEEISREHYIQWSLNECEDRLSEFMPVSRIFSTTFFPFVPKLWQLCLPVSNIVGGLFRSRYGGNIIAVCRKS